MPIGFFICPPCGSLSIVLISPHNHLLYYCRLFVFADNFFLLFFFLDFILLFNILTTTVSWDRFSFLVYRIQLLCFMSLHLIDFLSVKCAEGFHSINIMICVYIYIYTFCSPFFQCY